MPSRRTTLGPQKVVPPVDNSLKLNHTSAHNHLTIGEQTSEVSLIDKRTKTTAHTSLHSIPEAPNKTFSTCDDSTLSQKPGPPSGVPDIGETPLLHNQKKNTRKLWENKDPVQEKMVISSSSDEENEDTQVRRPNKKARFYFQRCFDDTFHPDAMPGASQILASDSDEG